MFAKQRVNVSSYKRRLISKKKKQLRYLKCDGWTFGSKITAKSSFMFLDLNFDPEIQKMSTGLFANNG